MLRSLNQLRLMRSALMRAKHLIHTRLRGMDIHPSAEISLSARFDRSFPAGVHIGKETLVSFEALIQTYDEAWGLALHTRIGERCFIGAHAIVRPGVTIGDQCVIGSGSVVTTSIPSHCVAAGNPARILRRDIALGPYGVFATADAVEARLRVETERPR